MSVEAESYCLKISNLSAHHLGELREPEGEQREEEKESVEEGEGAHLRQTIAKPNHKRIKLYDTLHILQ